GPASAGKLDLDVYAPPPRVAPGQRSAPPLQPGGWLPGNPKDLRGESRTVQYISHFGYAGLAGAGAVSCAAPAGVAPVVGFAVVAAMQLWAAWELHRSKRSAG
ncbi:MAG: hypothetical protein KGL53_00430, partial [Elusimicrobia bacterium]|nr:hypothetical protein [Elusimicrobiota bacterium]